MAFGPQTLFEGVSLLFSPGKRYGVVGANGAGKSTFLKILTGDLQPETGQVVIPQELKVGVLGQDHFQYEQNRVIDVVIMGNEELWSCFSEKDALLSKGELNDEENLRLADLETEIANLNGYMAEAEAAQLLEGLGLAEEMHTQTMSKLSGGFKLRVLLAQVLFGEPNVLLLDEPTNHLDIYSIKWLEGFLSRYAGTLVVISHDHDFLNGVCTHIADVDFGTIKIYTGNYDQFRVLCQEERDRQQNLLAKQEKRRDELQIFVDRFKAKASKARQAGSKAKMIEKLEDEIGDNKLVRSTRVEPRFAFSQVRASGICPLKVDGVTKVYGDKRVLHDVHFEIERGQKIAIIGPNGIGKSTLLNIITEHVTANGGSFLWGHETHVGYFPQDHHAEVHGTQTVLDWLWNCNPKLTQSAIREVLARALFTGDDVDKSVANLSGGEAARLILAKMMITDHNVLILDEPTNHLDLESITNLSQALGRYDGTVILVSHNRYFVSRIADRVIEISAEGARDFLGTYTEYMHERENDHLARDVSLKNRSREVEKIRIVSDAPAKKAQPARELSHAERKKLRNKIKSLERTIKESEKKSVVLEEKVAEIETYMASEEFYKAFPKDQRLKAREKEQIEDELLQVMEAWESAAAELEELTAEG
jgi:ATPase subunit of ABC transporter with duplicated ATPase domains